MKRDNGTHNGAHIRGSGAKSPEIEVVNARRVWKKEDKTNSVSQFLIYASVSHPTPLFPSRAPSSPPSLPPRSSLILYGSMKRLLSVGRNSEVWGVGWRAHAMQYLLSIAETVRAGKTSLAKSLKGYSEGSWAS